MSRIPDNQKKAIQGLGSCRRKIRETLYRHRELMTDQEEAQLEECYAVIGDIEQSMRRRPLI
jgi:hypothetical protein